MEPLAQLSALSMGVPVPLRLTMDEVPLEELLVSFSWPVTAPAVMGSKCTLNVAV